MGLRPRRPGCRRQLHQPCALTPACQLTRPPIRDDSSTPAQHSSHRPAPFKRTLGEYPFGHVPLPLFSLSAHVMTNRRGDEIPDVPLRSEDPRTRKQAMAEDRVGWGSAE
eukprot:2402056-Pleurochrysis_carterae.AAC.1